MEDKNYDCVGNEAVITDCQNNSVSCPSNNDFISRTEVNCKSKKKLFHVPNDRERICLRINNKLCVLNQITHYISFEERTVL